MPGSPRTLLHIGRWPPPYRTRTRYCVSVVAVVLMMTLSGVVAEGLECQDGECRQTFSIPEELPVDSYVGTVENTANTIVLPFIEFFSTPHRADATDAFNVDLNTGRITTKARMDREVVTDGYAFILNSATNPVLVTVKLLDVNDNSPAFNSPNITLNFSESSTLTAYKQSLGSVTDPDLGVNATQTCQIVSGNTGNAFQLLNKTSGSHDIILDLTVVLALDYELIPAYTLVIQATDGGGRTGQMTVHINVQDQNDNQPIFNQSKYEVRIAENVTVGTSITQVAATDQDSGDNGRITYSIRKSTDPGGHFTIDPDSGVVRVAKMLDFETQSKFRLTLEASDQGAQKQVGVAALDVNLTNINEQPANIRLVYLQGASRQGHIPENTEAGTPVARISIDDPDTTMDRQIDVNVTLHGGDNVFGLRITNDVLSLVVVNTPPDREVKAVYDLTIEVTDAGNPPLRASESFKVYIDDVNDNAPSFPFDPYRGEVNETAEVGTIVLRLTAVDRDDGDNAKIHYSIQSGSNPQAGWFHIDSSTGVITTRERIDCEVNPEPRLVVVARDYGEPALSGSTTVIITVRDVNDKQPEFETSFYMVKVDENYNIGECPIAVHATDPECGTSAPVSYQLVRNGQAPPEFFVNATSGHICVQSPGLDYERNTSYEFLVQAVDRDGLSASAVVQVKVSDVNDNDPTFEPQQYALNLEDTVPQGPLLTVQGSDLDSGPFGTVSYSFANDEGQGYFSIDAGSGTISLTRSFPRGTVRVFHLQVEGRDKGGSVSSENAQVTISVYSGDVHLPAFTLTMYNFTLSEDVAPGALVGRVEATVDSGTGTATASGLQYSVVYASRDWFRVDPNSGNVYTTAALDREAQQFVLLGVQAQTSSPTLLFSTAQVNVSLLDVNDNAPYFPASNVLQIEVREDTLLQDPVYIAHALDIDLGRNGSVLYRLADTHRNLFSIDEYSGQIFLRTVLDYEVRHRYQLTVVARDEGEPRALSSTMTLTVNVKDINDNGPRFSRNEYDFYVREDVLIGYEFGNVTATDADSDHNGRVSFSLKPSPDLAVFGIYAVQGVLSTRDNLDRESQDRYVLTVVATDHGLPPRSATATIRIHITDTNDNEPEFSRSEYKMSVLENQPRGTRVGQVSASDRDMGENQRLQYYFSDPQNKFAINTFNGEITALVPLDREETKNYTLKVNVTDSGVQSLSDSAVVKIQVLDQNDNAPQFSIAGSEHRETVGENQPKGVQIIRVRAEDPDAGQNGTVAYHLDPVGSDANALGNFSIHAVSGWLKTKEVLDYETCREYQLQVVATDTGNPPRSSTQIIYIDVLDDNDEAPLFHAREVNFYVAENLPVGSPVGRVEAEDRDSGMNGLVKYYMVGGNVFSLFAVDPSSGVIQTVREIDYEESSSHTLSIQAVDSNAAFPRSSNISVLIHVLDVNDNAPVFANDPVFLRTVRENTPVDYVVHTFLATDKDSGRNGTVRYSIANESASGPDVSAGSFRYFKVDSLTGQLRIARTIDYEQVHMISIIVEARDDCPDPALALASKVTAVVFVKDVNDNQPRFESRSEVHVFEDEPSDGSFPVIVVVAVDKDSNQDDSGNNQVNYGIVSGNDDGKFRLEQKTGLLTIVEALDRETRDSYLLNISAEDGGVPKMAAFQALRVSVVDVNDNPPLFQLPLYLAHVNESLDPGAHVTTVRATDNDKDNNGQLTYMIFRGIAGDKFAVNAETGSITTTQRLDREHQESYTLTVYVKDSGYPALYDIATVQVQVTDINDHAPEFEKPDYRIQVPENQPHRDVITIVASDRDAGVNADISYRITGGNEDGRFSLDLRSGDLSCGSLDREDRPAGYNLTILATDSGTPQQTGTTQVLVTILDENDNNPAFSLPLYSATVAEDVAKGHTVMRVFASDPDQGPNGQVTYSLLGNDTEGFFSVNSTSGDIITSGVFDREKNASFEFLLVASDSGGSGPRNTTVRIHVNVSDVNDNAPAFRQVPYKTSVAQATLGGRSVLQMQADDPDAGENGTVRYSLLQTTNSHSLRYFTIQPLSGVITTVSSLSDGAAGYHSLLVLATDTGSPALSTTGVAEITVGSGNSSSLRFEQEEYVKELKENERVNHTVAIVRVSNAGNAAVNYSFANGNSHNTFTINSQGVVKVADPTLLDFETTPELQLVVAAVAGGRHAYAKLVLKLTDVNDNSPKFAQNKYVSAIWENNKPQTYVTQVWARDADSGRNGMIDYEIISGNINNVFEIAPKHTGIVRTKMDASRLDREIFSSYELLIEARDYGVPMASARCSLHITVVDENDNEPNFPSPGPGPVDVPENRQPGVVVAVVTATDVDLNQMLVYDFTSQGNPDSMFSIDRSSGTVLLAKPLDHEARSHYTIGLQVSDGQHTDTTTLEVRVSDVNDNAPQFSRQSFRKAIPENTPPMTSLLTVLATDEDQGENGTVTYSLGASSMAGFFIDPRNGTIFTNRSISSTPANSVVQLVVVAADGGSPSLSTMVAVQIHITDVNNYSPRFNQTSYSAQVKESLQKGSEILQVSAIDRDYSHRNDNVHYILSGPSAATFYLESSSGRLMLNQPLDREQTQQYELNVMAVDRGTPPLNASVRLTVTVLDENDNAPVFQQKHYHMTLEENYPKERVFLTVSATDRDQGSNAQLEYSITSGNSDGNFFNYKSGGLIVMSPLDYETRKSHRLIVRVVDCANCSRDVPRLSAFVTVNITVTDVNEFPPRFPVQHYYETVSENRSVYSSIFKVHANDRDSGESSSVSYRILPGLDFSLFSVDSKTGDVIARKVFDYENPAERKVYNITIQASNPGFPTQDWSDTVGVTITVTDKDEFDPQFINKSGYSFSIPGSAKAGAYVGSVAARDRDAGSAGRLVFSFVHLSDYFQIDSVSGNITVANTLHDDAVADEAMQRRRRKRALRKDSETLIVKVSSGLENSRSDDVFCVINIDRTCPGCKAPLVADNVMTGGLGSVAIAMIVLVCILVPTIVVVLLLVFICRRRNRKGVPGNANNAYGRDPVGMVPEGLDDPTVPPPYKDVLHYNQKHSLSHTHPVNITSSDLSNNSASSGRGSAEVEDEDEEIRMITAHNSYLTNSAGYRQKTMPDSGIQQDEDTLSEPTATNHQEYLARLGIDSSKIGKPAHKPSSSKGSTSGSATGGDIAFSVESMHAFSDEGGGEGVMDVDRFTDTEVDEEMAMIEERRRHHLKQAALKASAPLPALPIAIPFQPPEPQQGGVLSSVVNSEEEYSGSYNWDYLLDWGPQYQPLAHVFAEIAKLKDESLTPKKSPIKTVPQRRINSSQAMPPPQACIDPPPIITNVPPRVGEAETGSERGSEDGHRSHRTGGHSKGSGSSSGGSRSQRTSAINSSLPSLPRSPISYESSYTSPALTPSFTPSLSPLGTHTPSISPAVSGHTGSHSGGQGHLHSGHSTPGGKHASKHPHHNHHLHHPHPRQHPPQHHPLHPAHHPPVHGRGQYPPHVRNGSARSSDKGSARVTLSASSDSEREFRI